MAIYDTFYGFRASPFRVGPDPQFLFLSRRHREALAGLMYAVSDAKGFAMLTGEVGTGKTTLVHAVLSQLGDRIKSAVILNPNLSRRELYQHLLAEFGLPAGRTIVDYSRILQQFLLEQFRAGVRVVVVIDEAHGLSPNLLEEVRLLSNFETAQAKLVQVLLVGQPELLKRLQQPDLRQLRQRLAFRLQLLPLAFRETVAYVRLRLATAGGVPDLFTPRAFAVLHRFSGGIPRLINILCDNALVSGFARDEVQIGGRLIHNAARDLGLPAVTRVPLWERVRLRFEKDGTAPQPNAVRSGALRSLGTLK
jgi:general secretion pathway protein A